MIQIASALGVIALVITVLIFSFAPKGTELPAFPLLPSDKVNHFVGNYALMLCTLAALPKLRPVVCALLIVLFGGCVEFTQLQVGREASIGDLAANIAGVLFAIGPVWMLRLRGRAPQEGPAGAAETVKE